ncbi:hypothetical protein J4226_01060 [Candidatus Pacearchaeota archaeon]|nr:hypothetical protein [Candidatus Pacearchaeota archaeon]
MKTKIIKQERNPFLQREELFVEIISETVPSSSELISILGKDKTITVVKKINTNFGQQKCVAEIVIYDNAKVRESIETIPQKVRKKMAAEKKAAEEDAKKKAAAEKAKEGEK